MMLDLTQKEQKLEERELGSPPLVCLDTGSTVHTLRKK